MSIESSPSSNLSMMSSKMEQINSSMDAGDISKKIIISEISQKYEEMQNCCLQACDDQNHKDKEKKSVHVVNLA